MTKPQALPEAEEPSGPDSQPDLFPDLAAWVHSWLLPFYRRRVEDGRHRAWCPQWWRHPEAVIRLTAVWRIFEDARRSPDPAATSVWIRDHLDYHMNVLTDPDGPLKGCNTADGHNTASALKVWPIADPPNGFASRTAADHYKTAIDHPNNLG